MLQHATASQGVGVAEVERQWRVVGYVWGGAGLIKASQMHVSKVTLEFSATCHAGSAQSGRLLKSAAYR